MGRSSPLWGQTFAPTKDWIYPQFTRKRSLAKWCITEESYFQSLLFAKSKGCAFPNAKVTFAILAVNSAVTYCIVFFLMVFVSFFPIFSEVLYEDEAFKQRQLSALLASKVNTCKSCCLVCGEGVIVINFIKKCNISGRYPLNRKLSMIGRKAFKNAE